MLVHPRDAGNRRASQASAADRQSHQRASEGHPVSLRCGFKWHGRSWHTGMAVRRISTRVYCLCPRRNVSVDTKPNTRKVGKAPRGEVSFVVVGHLGELGIGLGERENPFPTLPSVAPTAGNTRPVKSLGDKILLFPPSPSKEVGGAEPGRFLRWFWVKKTIN